MQNVQTSFFSNPMSKDQSVLHAQTKGQTIAQNFLKKPRLTQAIFQCNNSFISAVRMRDTAFGQRLDLLWASSGLLQLA
jgi:hypothetical protein